MSHQDSPSVKTESDITADRSSLGVALGNYGRGVLNSTDEDRGLTLYTFSLIDLYGGRAGRRLRLLEIVEVALDQCGSRPSETITNAMLSAECGQGGAIAPEIGIRPPTPTE